jgi:hypothetical protein
MSDSDIRELRLLADLESIAVRYEQLFGAPPINLSVWNPTPSLIRDLELQLPPTPDLKGIDYAFSYEMPERPALLAELGFDPSARGCLVTHSGSSGIIAASNWMKTKGRSKALIVGPRYFTVPYALASLGIDWTIAYMRRSNDGRFSFPNIEELVRNGIDSLWLTNPIYCTSIDYDIPSLNEFISTALRQNLLIVLDECLSEKECRIGPRFNHANVAAIYAPHKSVCVNGIKFAVVVFDHSEQVHFDSWCDVWNGCLPISSVVGVRHFLSADFERYRAIFRSLVSLRHRDVRSIVSNTRSITLDQQADGYLISIYAPQIEARAGLNLPFLERAANATGAIFISGARNELDPNAGLSFRLNLAAMDTSSLGALARLCAWLDQPSIF